MEALYKKLHNKYDALKQKRISELDEVNKDQEVKFLNYVSAAEELIQYLKSENDSLNAQLTELRSEIASIRSSKDEECARYQMQLMNEKQKNKMLSEEVERLQKLQEQVSLSLQHDKNSTSQLKMPQSDHVVSGNLGSTSMRMMTRKRSREARSEMEGLSSPGQRNLDDVLVSQSTKDLSTARKRRKRDRAENESLITPEQSNQANLKIREPENDSSRLSLPSEHVQELQHACCGKSVPGGPLIINGSSSCQFQVLIEYMLGMKMSAVNRSEGICVSVEHQSSGYSFSLTWVKSDAGKEQELLYRVSTLGTFERVAPEWMRSVLMFSTSMCPIFFARVARVIKTSH